MSELDRVLIELGKDRSTDLTSKSRVKVHDGLSFKKVAFDMYRVFGDQYDDLWKMESVDGESFLVRSSDPKYQVKEGGNWSAVSNYDHDSVTLSYRNVPICSFSSEEYGFGNDDIFTFKAALLEMVDEDEAFVKKIIASQAKTKADAIMGLFPDMIKKN